MLTVAVNLAVSLPGPSWVVAVNWTAVASSGGWAQQTSAQQMIW